MNCKSFHITFRRFLRGLGTIFLTTICSMNIHGQANISGYSDVSKQRLLIHVTAHYIHTISQGQIDMDSAVRIPCKLYGLSPLLIYNDGYSDGKPSAGTRLLDVGKVTEAKVLLAKLHNQARLRLLIELGSYFTFKPGTSKEDLDQAANFINEALVLSKTASVQWKIQSMNIKAHLLHQSGRLDESQRIFTEIVKLSEQSGNTLASAQALLSAGKLLPYGDKSRLPNFEKALAIFQKEQAKEKEIETLSEINVEHFVFKHYDVAEQLVRKIIALETQINFRHRQYAYDVLAYLSFGKADYTNALFYSNKGLECLISSADSVFSPLFYARQGNTYIHLQKFDQGISWFNKALENKSKATRLYWYKAFLNKTQVLSNIHKGREALIMLREIGSEFPPVSTFEKMYFAMSMGEAYQDLKQFRLAETNFNNFLQMAETVPPGYIYREFPYSFYTISTFYRIIGKTKRARQLLDRVKDNNVDGVAGKGNYYKNLFKIDSTEKRYLEAIKYLQISQVLMDSAFSNDQRKNADELLIKYEAEKKDRDIELLNSQNQLQLIRAQQANRAKNITLAGVVVLLIISGLLLNRYLIKQKSNRKLQALNADQDKLLKEKEWLIKEVHHRVKNNLQMVTSLLYSQSLYLEDDAAVLAVKDSLRRMQAMSLIHQKLYKDENTSTIAMPEYINDLVRYLHESFDTDNRITFQQTIEPLDLDVSQAIPLGLIITESIVNAIKYAFLSAQKGIVSLDLQRDGPGHLLLKISDNGVGLPAELDIMQHSSLGLDLIQGLTKQLKGSITIESNKGVHITLRFRA